MNIKKALKHNFSATSKYNFYTIDSSSSDPQVEKR